MAEDAVVERLDLLISAFKIAFAGEIAKTRDVVRKDAASAAILDATAEKAVKNGVLQTSVATSSWVDQRTVRRRIQDLVALGALRQIGSGSNVSYRGTGLI
jgi:predicted HTH transcriptional regulator